MKRYLLALALLLAPSLASAQCNGVFPNNTVCGNITGANNTPRPTSPTAFQGSAGGTNGQVQINSAGALAGESQVTLAQGGLNVSNAAAATNDTLFFNGTGFLHVALTTLINTVCQASPTTCTSTFGYAYAPWWGVKCDGTTDDGPAINTALAAINYARLWLPATSAGCKIATTIFYNSFVTPGVQSVSGIKLEGQGRNSTFLHAAVANGYVIATNPDWAVSHKALFQSTVGTAGSLATNTYFVQLTMNDGLGHEIRVGVPKSFSVIGATGSVSIPLGACSSGYSFNIYFDTASTPAHYATVAGVNAIAVACNQTVTITAIGSAQAFPTTNTAVWQEASINNLTIDNPASTANASGVLWFRTAYSAMYNVYMANLTGDGFGIPNWTGDVDGSFVVTIDQSKFDTIAGTCVNTAGNTLEFSNFTVKNTVFNLCGTLPTNYNAGFTITGITNANPGIVTYSSASTFIVGDQILPFSVTGITLPAGMLRVCAPVTTNSFALCDLNSNNINTTALGTFTGGGVNFVWRPPQMATNGNGPTVKGAVAYTGLISNWINNGFTQNKNYDIYFTEAGSNDNITLIGNDMENTFGKGLYVASAINLTWNNGECLSTAAIGETRSCMQLGPGGINTGNVTNAQINNIKVRSDSGTANGFEQFFGGGAIHQNTVSATGVYWQSWAGLNKYVGFLGNPAPFFWARFDGKTGSVCTLKDSFNITSCVRNSTGVYTLTLTAPSLDANYAVSGTGVNTGVAQGIIQIGPSNVVATTVVLSCLNLSSSAQDCDFVSVSGYGNPQ